MEAKHQAERQADPLIDEVRAIRQAIWDEDGRDLALHAERLRAIETQYANRLVTRLAPRPRSQSINK